MLSVKENIDISRFHQVSAFLKQQSVRHRPKKSKVFALEEMEMFLDNPSNGEYLIQKAFECNSTSRLCGSFNSCKVTRDTVAGVRIVLWKNT
ncbi:hypothetical protein Zmor_019018 [Zophobas morio]|uniref:Uncharacterized protein n=1 Tax=Zophobas morio TaxID=2755281 RepID=A0AA38IDC1_9CUCU|nr:hypothetical protein Zmor_019018 [Zophobas morio]